MNLKNPKVMKKIVFIGVPITLTTLGVSLATFYGVAFRKQKNYQIDTRSENEKLWDFRLNKSKYLYNNIFFPVSSPQSSKQQVDELASKYVFFQKEHFSSIENKKRLLATSNQNKPIYTFGIKFSDFELKSKNPSKLSILNFLDQQIKRANIFLNNYYKKSKNKKLALDFGTDYINREIFIRIWQLKNIDQKELTLIEDFMTNLENQKLSNHWTKTNYFDFLRSRDLLSNNIRTFLPLHKEQKYKDNQDIKEDSSIYLTEKTNPQQKEWEELEKKGFLKNASNNIFDFFYKKMIIDNKIVVTLEPYVDLNKNISLILFFNKLQYEGNKSASNSEIFSNHFYNKTFVKNPQYIEIRKFDITKLVEKVVETNDQKIDDQLNLSNFLISQNENEIPGWKQFVNHPLISFGLSLSGNFTPALDPYLNYVRSFFKKLTFLTQSQIKSLLTRGTILSISSEIKENNFLSLKDFNYFIGRFSKDLEKFWLNLKSLSSIQPNGRFSPLDDKQYAGKYRLFTTVFGLKIVADHLMPKIQEKHPNIYNSNNDFQNSFWDLFNILVNNQIIPSNTKFLNIINYFQKNYPIILNNISSDKGDEFYIPKNITKNIWSILQVANVQLPSFITQEKRANIANILSDYLAKPGSLKTILIHFLGGYKNTFLSSDTKNTIENVFSGNVISKIISSILDNDEIDEELLKVISKIIYEIDLNKIIDKQLLISLKIEMDFSSPIAISKEIKKILKSEKLKNDIRNLF